MNLLNRYLLDFKSLFFPKLCNGCRTTLTAQENLVCTACIYNLPFTDFHIHTENQLEKTFWGKVIIQNASAYLYFKQGGIVQSLMHQLKYNNMPELGIWLGEMYGKQLTKFSDYSDFEAIIPVPLHKTKQRKRGYNQSEQIAIGLSKVLGIPVVNDVLKRTRYADSQVQKSRISRYDNLKASFSAENQQNISKAILIDDTITTGATLEACAHALNSAGIDKISILGIAYTS